MSFPHGLVPTTDRVHPTPIYEFIGACLIAWLLWKMGSSFAVSNSKSRSAADALQYAPGQIFAAYLVLTGVARFLVESIRLNPRVLWGLTNAQLASIASIVVGAILWLRLQTHQSREVRA